MVALSGDSVRFRFAGVALDSASVALSEGSAEEWGWLEGCRQYWGVIGTSHGPIMAFMASFAPHMVVLFMTSTTTIISLLLMMLSLVAARPVMTTESSSLSTLGRSLSQASGGLIADSNPIYYQLPQTVEWTVEKEEEALGLLASLQVMLDSGNMTSTLIKASLASICNPNMVPADLYPGRCDFWKPYRNAQANLTDFMTDWLYYVPIPSDAPDGQPANSPGWYIERWDWLANTLPGRKLIYDDEEFKDWFRDFLNMHGYYLSTNNSFDSYVDLNSGPLYVWEEFGGRVDTFNMPSHCPLAYGGFVGGPIIDSLLWFTDYHHFHAPVTGTIIHIEYYWGTYNYDFDDFNPNDPYQPKPSSSSDRVEWYKNLDKHQRAVIIS
eukprot:gene13639-19521_t